MQALDLGRALYELLGLLAAFVMGMVVAGEADRVCADVRRAVDEDDDLL